MRLLADATALDDPGCFREDAIADAVDHLERARDAAPEGSDTAEAVHVALACLEAIEDADGTERRRQNVRNALAALAPVTAGGGEHHTGGAEARTMRPREEKPDVPVFYNIPAEVVNRAIERYEARQQNPDASDDWVDLLSYVYDEIYEVPVLFVGGEPLAEYHGRTVDVDE